MKRRRIFALALAIALSRVPLRTILRGLRPLVFILIFTFVLNLFLSREGEVLWHWWIFSITQGGVRTAVRYQVLSSPG